MTKHYVLEIEGVANPRSAKRKKTKVSAKKRKKRKPAKRRPKATKGKAMAATKRRRKATRKPKRKVAKKRRTAKKSSSASKSKRKAPVRRKRRNPVAKRKKPVRRKKTMRRKKTVRRRRRRNPVSKNGFMGIDLGASIGTVLAVIGVQYLNDVLLPRKSKGVQSAALKALLGFGASIALGYVAKMTGMMSSAKAKKIQGAINVGTAAHVGFDLAAEVVKMLPKPNIPLLAQYFPAQFPVNGLGESIYAMNETVYAQVGNADLPSHLEGYSDMPSHLSYSDLPAHLGETVYQGVEYY